MLGVWLGLSILTGLGGEMLTCDLVTTVSSILKPLCVHDVGSLRAGLGAV